MLSLSPAKLLIVLVIALILLGPDKLPGVAKQMGAAWKAFHGFRERMETEVRSQLPDLPSTGDIAKYARSPVSLLNKLAEMPDEDLEPAVLDPSAEAPAPDPTDSAPWPSDPAATDVAPTSPAPATSKEVTGTGLRVPDDPSMN